MIISSSLSLKSSSLIFSSFVSLKSSSLYISLKSSSLYISSYILFFSLLFSISSHSAVWYLSFPEVAFSGVDDVTHLYSSVFSLEDPFLLVSSSSFNSPIYFFNVGCFLIVIFPWFFYRVFSILIPLQYFLWIEFL